MPIVFYSVIMKNIIGDNKPESIGPNQFLHMYGKKEVRAGRKMGHLNILEC